MDITYSGHGHNTGGLQEHSVGDIYPLSVYAQETPEGLQWGILNLAEGRWAKPRYSTCADATTAAQVARTAIYANRHIKRIIEAGGHHA